MEVGAFGKENYNLTGYFNMPKVLEITLHNGCDPRTGQQIGLRNRRPARVSRFSSSSIAAFETQLRHFVDIKVRGNHVIERLYAAYMPAPFLSLLIDDCIARGKDYHDGGARYNTSYIQGVGAGHDHRCRSARSKLTFSIRRHPGIDDLLDALDSDFSGSERMRWRCSTAPRATATTTSMPTG